MSSAMCGSKLVTVLGFALCGLARGSCSPQTAAEAMVSLRTAKGCTNPATIPSGCATSPNTEAKITCNAANKALWDGSGAGNWSGDFTNWFGDFSECIKVTPDKQEDWAKHDFHYPSGYANTCDEAGQEPGSHHCTWVTAKTTSTFAEGVGYNSNWDSETWCSNKFRWVDPCTCDKTDIVLSTWLAGYYSYSACGAADTYTKKTTCTATDRTQCTAKTGCKWTDPELENVKCTAQTGAEAMVSLRTAKDCTNPETPPNGCATSPNKEAKVTCDAANKALWDGNWSDAASNCIKVTPDKQKDWVKHDFHYPSNYADTCTQAAKEPGSYHCTWLANKTHSFENGAGYNSKWDSETWCLDQFRWVDPCTCDKLDISKSSWLSGYYSYSACGATDKYTPISCGDILDKTECVAKAGCKWPDTNSSATTSTSGSAMVSDVGETGPRLPVILVATIASIARMRM